MVGRDNITGCSLTSNEARIRLGIPSVSLNFPLFRLVYDYIPLGTLAISNRRTWMNACSSGLYSLLNVLIGKLE